MRTLKNIVNLTPEDQYAIFEKKAYYFNFIKITSYMYITNIRTNTNEKSG